MKAVWGEFAYHKPQMYWVCSRHVRTAIFKMNDQQGPTAQHRELCSMLCGGRDGRGVWGKMDPCTCMAESP